MIDEDDTRSVHRSELGLGGGSAADRRAAEPQPDPRWQKLSARLDEIEAENRRLLAQLLSGDRRFRRLARSVWRVEEQERRRLARELHDGLGQVLTALKHQLDRLAAEELPAGPARERVAEASSLAAQALADTRELSRLLRPPILDDLGLEPALRWLARSLREKEGLAIELALRGLEERLSAGLETFAFRFVQEALTNVVRHAGAAVARVDVEADEKTLRIRVADDGRGLPDGSPAPAEEWGTGLRGLQDRVELLHGELEIDSRPGRGLTLTARVPRVGRP